LRKVNKSAIALSKIFSTIFLFLMFCNIQIDLIILKTYDQQFTLTTKKSLHIIFKAKQNISAYDSPCQILNPFKSGNYIKN